MHERPAAVRQLDGHGVANSHRGHRRKEVARALQLFPRRRGELKSNFVVFPARGMIVVAIQALTCQDDIAVGPLLSPARRGRYDRAAAMRHGWRRCDATSTCGGAVPIWRVDSGG